MVMILNASTKISLPLKPTFTLSVGLVIFFFANNQHAAVAKLETLCPTVTSLCYDLLPDNLKITSSLSSHELIKAGEPVTLTCNADLMDLDEKHTYVARMILLSDCAGDSPNLLVDYSPESVYEKIFNKNDGRDWEVTFTAVKLNTLSLNVTRGRGFQLTFNDADCRDACTYECAVDARITGSKDTPFFVSRQQRVHAPMEGLQITIDPVKENYTEKEEVKLTCTVSGSDVNITWKQSLMADGVFIDYPTKKDISMDVSTHKDCNRTSILAVTVTGGSKRSQYKCIATQGNKSEMVMADLKIAGSEMEEDSYWFVAGFGLILVGAIGAGLLSLHIHRRHHRDHEPISTAG